MGSILRFRESNVGRQQGERARLKVVHGPDFGIVFVVTSDSVTIGRGDKSDIVLSDLKASRVHAEISSLGEGWIARDLGSSNGILHNGKTTKSTALRTGDSLTIGESTLEFISSDANTQMLLAAPGKGMAVNHAVLQSQKNRIQAVTSMGGKKPLGVPPGIPSNQPNPSGLPFKKVVLYSAILGALWFGLSYFEDQQVQPRQKKKVAKQNPVVRNLAAFLPGMTEASRDLEDASEKFFKAGFREYREKNFLRARKQFETVLQINPGHKLAKLYLQNSIRAIKDEVKQHLVQGSKNLKSGKLKKAQGHFEAVKRLLYRDQENPAFTEATDQLNRVKEELARRR